VMCLDVLRALARSGDEARAILAQLATSVADLSGAKETAGQIGKILGSADAEPLARLAVEQLAILAATAALAAHAPGEIASGFAETNLGGSRGSNFGAAAITNPTKVLDRALPN